MSASASMTFPLSLDLLALAIVVVWFPAWHVGGRRVAPWMLVFACAVAAGAVDPVRIGPFATVLTTPALGVLAALCAFAWAGLEAPRRRPAFVALTGFLAFVMSLHLLPGFHNPELLRDVRLTPDAAP